jgi:hypothetical protein
MHCVAPDYHAPELKICLPGGSGGGMGGGGSGAGGTGGGGTGGGGTGGGGGMGGGGDSWCPGGLALSNASFEAPVLAIGGSTDPDLTAWTTFGSVPPNHPPQIHRPVAASLDQVEPLASPADGNQVINFPGENSFGDYNTGVVVEAGKTYTLTLVAAAAKADPGGCALHVTLKAGDITPLGESEEINVFCGGTAGEIPTGSWATLSVAYTASAAGAGLPVVRRSRERFCSQRNGRLCGRALPHLHAMIAESPFAFG